MHRRQLGVVVAIFFAALVPAAPALATTGAAAKPPSWSSADLDHLVTAAMVARTGQHPGAVAAAGRAYQVSAQRRDATGAWTFGFGVLRASDRAGDHPQAWLFLAERSAGGAQVALEGEQGFVDLANRAPDSVFSAAERATFVSAWQANSADVGVQAMTNNTLLRLPYGIGQSWTMTGGPHGWGGTDTPYSSVDLNGGDLIVRAGGAGTVYTICADSSNGGTPGGWRRVYHSSGYTTDYYHMWNLTSLSNGQSIGAGTALGNTGTNLCAGGAASGRHVHWGILSGTTRVAWHWRSAGKWVFWQGAAYGGYALHGSTQVNPGGTLYNYGPLGANQGIVDAWGSGYVNKRSGPGTGYPIVGTVTDGTTITISCWNNGTTHTGRWGTTSVWNKLTDNTWVTDAFVYTGATTVGPHC